MRLTFKKLLSMVNESFARIDVDDLEAIEAYNPRHRSQDIEAGACLIVIKCRRKGESDTFNLYSFYWRDELEREINKGAVIGFDLASRHGGWSWIDASIKPVFLKPESNKS